MAGLAAGPALACDCTPMTVCELIQQPTIFIGEVIDGGITSHREDPWRSDFGRVRFKVLESLRGLPRGTRTVDVRLMSPGGMCSPIPYHSGKKYLVVPNEDDGALIDGPCFSARNVDTEAEDVRQVRAYFSGKMPTNVHGQVAVADDPSMIGYLLGTGEAKLLGGVTISAERRGRVYSAVSGSDGRYRLPLPAGGGYTVRAALKPYESEPESEEISIPVRGCAIQDFALRVHNTISGRVWDKDGQPVKSAKVGLIDLSDPIDSQRYRTAYTDQADLTFRFKNVPIGRYLVVAGPDGLLDRARANSEVIEIKSAGVHLSGMDLKVGERAELRPVTVRVRFPDGAPMKTAQVRCLGLPRGEGEAVWSVAGAAEMDGAIKLMAPANRQLKIEVRDAYGRDLKETYSSLHEPSSAPITQEFVVIP